MRVWSWGAGAKFDFISYMRDSMEDDYGRLVGLGLPMWLFLIFFVLLSSVWGKCPTLAHAFIRVSWFAAAATCADVAW